jgi:hypothetical protein
MIRVAGAVIAWLSRSLDRRIGALLLLVSLVGYGALYMRGLEQHKWPHGDGYYSWMYARSLAFDGDIDLTNDYRICGDPAESKVIPQTGRPANYFYFGPALGWAPVLWVVRHVVTVPAGTESIVQNACRGPLATTTGAICILFPIACIFLTYRAARRVAGPWGAFVGALVTGFGSTLAYYGTALWFYSHALSALGAALALVAWLRAREEPEDRLRWYIAGIAVAVAALMRPQEAVWGLLPAYAIVERLRVDGIRKAIERSVVLAGGFVCIYSVQLIVYKKIFGVYWLVPQGKLYMQPLHAHPFLLLFSGTSGFFAWTPLMWLGVLGLAMMLRDRTRRALAIPLLVAFAISVWASSSPLSWSGANTFGARVLTSCTPMMGLGAAAFVTRARRWVFARKWRTRVVLAAALIIPFEMLSTGLKSSSEAISPDYGASVALNFDTMRPYVGNPFTFPATALFGLRYHVPASSFDRLAVPGMFVHSFRTGALDGTDHIDFGGELPLGFVGTDRTLFENAGMILRPGVASRFLVSLYWPWITHVGLSLVFDSDGLLDIEACSFTSCKSVLSKRAIPKGTWSFEVPVEEGVFDSGINEVRITADAPAHIVKWTWFDKVERKSGIVGL